MTVRFGQCEVCSEPVQSGTRGAIPRLCAACRNTAQLQSNREYKQRNPEIVALCRENDKPKSTERWRRWAAANPELRAERRRDQYLRNQQATAAEKVRSYRLRNPGKHAEIENRRRARLLKAFVAPVDPVAIYERDGGRCALCGEPVEITKMTMDHIIPLSRGGTHEPANVQLAHGPCNSRKGNRLIA